MKDRLESLREQRALIVQHLSWIDSEIALSGDMPPKVETKISRVTQTAPPSEKPPEGIADLELAQFDAEFEVNRQSVHGEVRNEIFLYAGIATFLLASLVIYVTFFY